MGASLTLPLSSQAQEAGVTRLAVALPLSGPQRVLGKGMLTAAEATVKVLNDTGGVAGRRVTLDVFDDACSVDRGTAIAREVAAAVDRIAAVFGHPCPSVTQVVAPIYGSHNAVTIFAGSLAGRGAVPPRGGASVFRVAGEGTPAQALASALLETPSSARIGLVRDRTQLATATVQQVQAQLVKSGRGAVMMETYAGGDKDFTAFAERCRAQGVTHLAFAGFPAEAILLLDALSRSAPDVRVVGTDTLATAEFVTTAEEHAQRLRIVLATDTASFPEAASSAYSHLRSDATQPTRNALALVAAIEAWAHAARAAPSLAPSDIAKALHAEPHATVMGRIAFDERGQANVAAYALHAWSHGAWRPVAAAR